MNKFYIFISLEYMSEDLVLMTYVYVYSLKKSKFRIRYPSQKKSCPS